MIKSIALTILVLFMVSCSTIGTKENSLPLHLITNAAVSRVLFENPEWAAPCHGITSQAIEALKTNKIIKLSDLEGYVREQVQWDKLTIDEKMLIDTVIIAVKGSIEQHLRDINVDDPGEVRVQLIKVLLWINKTAYRHLLMGGTNESS